MPVTVVCLANGVRASGEEWRAYCCADGNVCAGDKSLAKRCKSMREQDLDENDSSHGGFEHVEFCDNARAHAFIFNKFGALWCPYLTRGPTDFVRAEKALLHLSMQNEPPMPIEVALVVKK